MYNRNRQNEQIYGRNDMVMLDGHNKIYGSLGTAEQYVFETVEGNPVVLQNPVEGKVKDVITEFSMQGWTEQNSTTGAQMFDPVGSVNGLLNADGSIVPESMYQTSDYIEVNEGESYYCTKTGSVRGKYYNSNKEPIQSTSYEDFSFYSGASIIIPQDVSFIRFSFSNDNIDTIMLNKGSTALPYEPYTGGQPSPSPDYPQEIVNAGKYNEDTQKWEYEVKLTGKNLFDAEYFRTTLDWKPPANENGYPYIPIYVGKGNTVTISTDGTPDEGLGFYCVIARTNKNTSDNVYTWIYHSNTANLIKTNVSFGVVEDDYIYFSLNVGHGNIEKFLNAFTNFQIEISAQKTEYQPYKEQTVILTADRPLTKWDRLEKRNGQWGWAYKSEEIESYTDESVPGEYYSTTGQLSVGAQVWYETTQETFVPLSESEQEAMNELTMNIPTTVISNDVEANMRVTYKVTQVTA